EARTCPHGHPIGDYPREPGVPLTAATTGSVVRVLRFENEDHDLLRMFRRAGVEPRASYTIAGFDDKRARLDGPQGPTELPLYAARTISVAVERSGDGDPAERDPESLATAYLLGETQRSRESGTDRAPAPGGRGRRARGAVLHRHAPAVRPAGPLRPHGPRVGLHPDPERDHHAVR